MPRLSRAPRSYARAPVATGAAGRPAHARVTELFCTIHQILSRAQVWNTRMTSNSWRAAAILAVCSGRSGQGHAQLGNMPAVALIQVAVIGAASSEARNAAVAAICAVTGDFLVIRAESRLATMPSTISCDIGVPRTAPSLLTLRLSVSPAVQM